MSKLQSFMEEKFIPLASKVSNNRYLSAVSGGSVGLMTIIIVGAIFSLLASIGFKPYQDFITANGIKDILNFVSNATTNVMALYMVASVGYVAAKKFGHSELAFNISLLALVSFILLIPITVIMPEGGFMPDNLINMSYLGAKGVFLAIIIGLSVARIYSFIVDKNWTVKMPDGTPEQVTKAFTSLIPAFVIVTLFSLVKYGFSVTHFKSANDFIYSMLQTPLQHLAGNLTTFVIIVMLSQILWFFGIHGGYTVLPIFIPIWLSYIPENTAAVAAGQAIPNIYNIGLFDITALGGCGATIGLVILMCFRAKSQRYKTFGKMLLPCGIFNINEPLVFGMPLILNPIMMIPFLVTPLVMLFSAVALIKLNIMPAPIGIMLPSLPPIVSGLVQGSWKISVFQVVQIVISILIYLPFFRAADKIALEEENKEKELSNETVKA